MGNRGAFHVTAIINGYIPTLSHGTILAKQEREWGMQREGRNREKERAFE